MRLEVGVRPPYPVLIGRGLAETVANEVQPERVALVTDSAVGPLHAPALEDALARSGKQVRRYTVAPGEASKTLDGFGRLLRALAQDGTDRGAAVLALGGGVVGDLAGYVAASYMRGLAFYNAPTTLLAMVDASVGGKTGLNLPEGKNLVGAFWQPRAVFADVNLLATLPEREFRQGAVEHFKHGLIGDPGLLETLHHPDFAPGGDPTFLEEAVGRSVAVKARVVAADEREAGERAHLNLGHTLAHALEAWSAQGPNHHPGQRLSHGDAVAYGLVFALKLSALRGLADETARALALLEWLEPAPLGELSLSELVPYLARDKKGLGGSLRWVLLERLGRPCLASDVSEDELAQAWNFLREVSA